MAEKKSYNQKAKLVDDLVEQIKNSKTLMIVSIKSLPSRQFQDIKKSIRDEAKVIVARKNIMLRIIKKLGEESILSLEKYIREDCAFIFSNKEGFELAKILNEKRTLAYAKTGQIASKDIEIKEGPTDLVPGPDISELGALGIQISIDKGKISIKAPKVIVMEGDIIKKNVASLLQKLDIQPFSVGLEPKVIYDVENKKIYTEIKINPEESINELKICSSKALGFAQKIIYFCKETINSFLVKANSEMEVLKKFKGEEVKEESKEEVKEEKVEEKPAEEETKNDTQLNKSEETA